VSGDGLNCPDADFPAFFLTAQPSAAPTKTDSPTREWRDDVVCWADLSIESLDCAVYVYPLCRFDGDGSLCFDGGAAAGAAGAAIVGTTYYNKHYEVI